MGLQEEGDDSDDDFAKGAAGKTAAAGGSGGMFGAGAGGGLFNPAMPMDMAGGPSNMGKVGDACESPRPTLARRSSQSPDALIIVGLPLSSIRCRPARRQHQDHV